MSARLAPVVRFYRGFNPRSTTMTWSWSYGDCFGPYVPESSLLAWDPAVAPSDEDLVLIEVPASDGTRMRVIKQLCDTPFGPYLVCEQGAIPVPPPEQCRFGGTRVAMVTFPGWATPSWLPLGPRIPMPEELKRELALENRHAISWLISAASPLQSHGGQAAPSNRAARRLPA